MSLKEGQYQIGDMVMGNGTQIIINDVATDGYSVNVYDSDLETTDEIRFGLDSLKPGELTLQLGIMDNYSIIEGPTGPALPGFKRSNQIIQELVQEWRADAQRRYWGSTKPLYYCASNEQRVVFGRPRKITPVRTGPRSGFTTVVCTYQMIDTFSYSASEFVESGAVSTAGTQNIQVDRTSGGTASTWCRFLVTGPITNPVIEVVGDENSFTIETELTLAAGVVMEINAYPWQRRVINSNSETLSAFLVGDSPYLDEMKFESGVITNVGLSGTDTSSSTKLDVVWRECYYNII